MDAEARNDSSISDLKGAAATFAEVKDEGTVQLFDDRGIVRKIPIPTDHPDDPLTWPLWTRCLVFTVICVYGISGFGVVQSTPLFFGDIIADYMKETRGVSP